MTIPPEMIEATARALIECMGPLFGSPEYLADPVKLARAEKRRADGARTYALAAIRTLAPMMAEVMAEVAEKCADDRFAEHGVVEPDTNASYYSGSRAEAYDELDEEDWAIARDIRAKGKEMADG